MEVSSNDVVKVVLQFLRESGLTAAARALREESGVDAATAQSPASVRSCVAAGDWAGALQELGGAELPPRLATRLFEEAIGDLVRAGDTQGAQLVLRESVELAMAGADDGELMDRLQNMAHHPFSQEREAALKDKQEDRERRRLALSQEIFAELEQAAPSRLLELIGNALTWRKKHGLGTHLLGSSDMSKPTGAGVERLKRIEKSSLDAEIPSKRPNHGGSNSNVVFQSIGKLKLGGASPLCVAIGDKNSIAVGTSDGFIEFWSWEALKRRRDLEYQEREPISHSKRVLGVAFSAGERFLASCSLDGTVRLWKVDSGACVLKVKKAHGGLPVNSVALSAAEYPTKILSAGEDNFARCFSTSGGNQLAAFSGPAPVCCACFCTGETLVATGSSDNTVRIYDAGSGQLLSSVTFDSPICGISPLHERIFVCSTDGGLEDVGIKDSSRKVVIAAQEKTSFITGSASPSLALAAASDGAVYSVQFAQEANGALSDVCKTSISNDDSILCLALHHSKLAVGTRKGVVQLFAHPSTI